MRTNLHDSLQSQAIKCEITDLRLWPYDDAMLGTDYNLSCLGILTGARVYHLPPELRDWTRNLGLKISPHEVYD